VSKPRSHLHLVDYCPTGKKKGGEGERRETPKVTWVIASHPVALRLVRGGGGELEQKKKKKGKKRKKKVDPLFGPTLDHRVNRTGNRKKRGGKEKGFRSVAYFIAEACNVGRGEGRKKKGKKREKERKRPMSFPLPKLMDQASPKREPSKKEKREEWPHTGNRASSSITTKS